MQAQAGPHDGMAWVDIDLEVKGHFLTTNEETKLDDVVEEQQTWDSHFCLTPTGSSDKGPNCTENAGTT